MRPYYVIKSLSSFWQRYHELKAGDLILTRLPLKKEDYPLFLDLTERGILSYPSFLSHLLSQSKCLQAEVLREFMPPHTKVIRAKIDLLNYIQKTQLEGKVIVKRDRANCGLGVHLFQSLEEVFNFAGTQVLEFPFVIQPFFSNWVDIRVIILGDLYVEAYVRENLANFRQNLFFGGKSKTYELTPKELDFCFRVMERGKFPQAHLDLAYIDGDGPFLSEINLKGGIKGARISPAEYEALSSELEKRFFSSWAKDHSPYIVL
jgi:glutathione synthase/RimK-type ligase-like ATP-grasp enzyme